MLNSDVNYREQSKELVHKLIARNGITHTANLGIIPDIHARMRSTNNQGSHSVFSDKPRLFMKKKIYLPKKQKCKKTHEYKYMR